MLKRKTKHYILHSKLNYKFDFFEQGIEETINFVDQSLKECLLRISEIENKVPIINDETYLDITAEEWGFSEKYADYDYEKIYTQEYLNALAEIKILYLFKNFEILIKHMISTSYAFFKDNGMFKWDTMKSFLKSKEIDISTIDGYNECLELRKLNNSIKHSETLSVEVKNITEFRNMTELDFENLQKFYDRIRPKVDTFYQVLAKMIIHNLYFFDDKKVCELANEYYEKMDETITKFINELQKKIK